MSEQPRPYEPLTSENAALILIDFRRLPPTEAPCADFPPHFAANQTNLLSKEEAMHKRALLMIAFVGSALSGFASSAYAAEFGAAEDQTGDLFQVLRI